MFIKSRKYLVIFFINFVLMIYTATAISRNKNDDQQQQETQKEIWEQHLTDTFKIEGSDQGIQKVNLKCGSNSMHIMLETEKPFTGVMYTRGSFYKQTAPCFVKPSSSSVRSIEMTFQLNQCQTIKEGELYTNVVVIQNDPELITPGDSAFSLECDFRSPRNLDVKADMQTRERIVFGSKISLTTPDQSATPEGLINPSVNSSSDTVVYITKKNNSQNIIHEDAPEYIHIHMGSVEQVELPLNARDEL
uniref:ZP domain-containing protein n=1 Tax=Glossina palpalis gambiensis TaxID=67801 RepID=A0A1B0BW94_9MUSC